MHTNQIVCANEHTLVWLEGRLTFQEPRMRAQTSEMNKLFLLLLISLLTLLPGARVKETGFAIQWSWVPIPLPSGLEQVPSPLSASVSSSVKWEVTTVLAS